jgi:hypothetical protein
VDTFPLAEGNDVSKKSGWMWPIREFESGIRRAEIAQRARQGHADAHRSQRIAQGLTGDWDHEAVRFERHAPGTTSCGKTLALDMIEGRPIRTAQTMRLKACAVHCTQGRDLNLKVETKKP